MKTKSFLLFSTSVFAISIFLIVFHSQPPQSIQSIVTQTHQHIKDFQASLSQQESLRDVEENHLVQEEQYSRLLGLDGRQELWHNTTTPALVTYARSDAHAQAVSFIRAAAKLPYTVLLYNIGLKPYSLAVVSNYCNSSKCAIIDLDLDAFPSHVSDESIHAIRPLIIQHALSRVGGVVFCEASQRWTGTAAELGALWARAAAGAGVLAWPRRAAVTSLTHPRMFHYFHATIDDFLFVQMMDVTRLVVANKPAVLDIMRPWIQCALTLDCIMQGVLVHRCTIGGLSVRQEAAVPVLGLPRPGCVGAQHRAGAALGLRGGGVRRARAPRALALRGRRRRARRAGGAAAQQLGVRARRLPHRARRRRRAAHGARQHLSAAPAARTAQSGTY